MATEVKIKRWGGSLAVIIPEEEVKAQKLKEGEEVGLVLIKKARLGDLFGSVKELRGVDLQEAEREFDEGWESGALSRHERLARMGGRR
ncbi:MAG: hypothetical protein QXT68_09065 [Halobacteria archaeon]